MARITAYRRVLDAVLPGCVSAVVLFGSHARGDATADSDYDLAVLLQGDLARRATVRAAIADAAYDFVVEGYALTPVALPGDYLEQVAGRYRTELARHIACEGMPVP